MLFPEISVSLIPASVLLEASINLLPSVTLLSLNTVSSTVAFSDPDTSIAVALVKSLPVKSLPVMFVPSTPAASIKLPFSTVLLTKLESAIVTLSAFTSITVPFALAKVALRILTFSESMLKIGEEPLASKVLPFTLTVRGLSIVIPVGSSVSGSKV